jgi:autotransporter-associated beta strand protein
MPTFYPIPRVVQRPLKQENVMIAEQIKQVWGFFQCGRRDMKGVETMRRHAVTLVSSAVVMATFAFSTAVANAETILYQDDFSNGNTRDGWVQMTNGASAYGYDGTATIVPAAAQPSSLWHNFADTVLVDGGTLTLSFDVMMSRTIAHNSGIRFGLGYSSAPLTDGDNLTTPVDGYMSSAPFLGDNGDCLNYWMDGDPAGINWGNAVTVGYDPGVLDDNDSYTITNSEMRTIQYRISRNGEELSGETYVNGAWSASVTYTHNIADFKFNAVGLMAPYNAGKTFTYDNVNVTVTPPSLNVTLTSPTDGQQFPSGSSITATVEVTGGEAPYDVTFYTNSAIAWSTNDSPSSLFTIDLGVLADGTYTNYATVTDNVSSNATSVTNTFTVAPDTDAPNPNPMTFAVVPWSLNTTTIVMTASTATDALSEPVYYYFENTTNTDNSGWISSTVWTNTGLTEGTTYGYQVKARDSATPSNETAFSSVFTAGPPFTGTFNKADNADDLDQPGSWTEPGRPGASDTARFDNSISAANRTMELGASLSWDQISVGNNGTFTFNDTPGTSTLTLGAGGIVGAVAFVVINADVALGTNQTWGGVRGVTLNSDLSTAGFNLTVDGAGGIDNPYLFSGTSVISGSGNLTFTGGKGALGGANTYTGSTTVNSTGVLYLDNENALGDSSTRVLNVNGGAVGPDDNLSLAGANPTPIVLSGGGRIFFDATTSDDVSQTLDINSDISGNGGLVLDVQNLRNNQTHVVDVTFGGDNDYDGTTTLRTTGRPTVGVHTHHDLIVRNGLADALPTDTVLEFDNRFGQDNSLPDATRQPISYDLNGFNQQVAGLTQSVAQAVVGYLDANAVVNSGAAATLTVTNSTDYTFHGWLGVDNYGGAQAFPETGNNFGLTKTGSGVLTLTAEHSFTGPTVISGGVLDIREAAGLANSSLIQIDTGGILRLENADNGGSVWTHADLLAVNANLNQIFAYAANGAYTDITPPPATTIFMFR